MGLPGRDSHLVGAHGDFDVLSRDLHHPPVLDVSAHELSVENMMIDE